MDHPQAEIKIDTENRTCEMHGDYEAKRLFASRFTACPKCVEQERAAREAREAAERKSRQEANRAARVEVLLRESGLIGRQLECTFDSYRVTNGAKQQAVLDDCRAYIELFQRGQDLPTTTLWLIGPAGTGKSHLGAAMVNHLIRTHATSARVHTVKELIRMLRAMWNRDRAAPATRWVENDDGSGHLEQIGAATEDELIRDLGECTLLVLDDVGAGHGSEAELVQLLEIVDLRYRLQRPTVVLSNLTATELKGTVGDRLYDRLREGATIKACNWGSMRGEFARRAA